MSTIISKLYLHGELFVPISAAEAVMVNGDLISGFDTGLITTLDKVLKLIRLISGGSAQDVDILLKNFNAITAGEGIKIDKVTDELTGVTTLTISNTLQSTLFVVDTKLPEPSEEYANKVYIIISNVTNDNNNNCDEFICVKSNKDIWVWERFGSISIENSIQSSITSLDTRITNIENIGVTAVRMTLSDGLTPVSINYDIPSTLYDVSE